MIQGDHDDQENPETDQPPTRQTSQNAAKRANAAKQVAPAKKSNPPKPPAKVYILFGADEYAKPRAAQVLGVLSEDAALLAKAAAPCTCGWSRSPTRTWPKLRAKLPAGRLHANGKGLVPYIKGALYMELIVANLRR